MNDSEVGILNVGAGDIRISFDPKNAGERIRAARIVKDMLRGGYALLVKVGKSYQRALDFDESKCEYIVADFDPTQGGVQGAPTPEPAVAAKCACGCGGAVTPGKRYLRGHHNRKRVPAEKTHSVAVSRSAGG
jgi:hypothetical protein